MAKLALLVACVAAVLAGWLASERGELHATLARVDEAQQGVEARVLAAERAVAELQGRPLPEATLTAAAPTPEGGTAAGATTVARGPGLVPTPRPPATTEERLARLEQDLAAARAERAAHKEAGKDEGSSAPFVLSSPRFLGSLEQAEKQLKLDAAQKAGLERVIEEVERDLDALTTRPNEQGKTLKELQESLHTEGAQGEDGIARFHEQMAALTRFRQGKVPGTSETYAEAERRIRKDGKTRARSYLSPEQAKTWDRSHTDALFRGGDGGGNAVMITSFEAGPAIQLNIPDAR